MFLWWTFFCWCGSESTATKILQRLLQQLSSVDTSLAKTAARQASRFFYYCSGMSILTPFLYIIRFLNFKISLYILCLCFSFFSACLFNHIWDLLWNRTSRKNADGDAAHRSICNRGWFTATAARPLDCLRRFINMTIQLALVEECFIHSISTHTSRGQVWKVNWIWFWRFEEHYTTTTLA